MQIARPPEGFHVTWTTTVSALINAEVQRNPEFARYWEDIVERLRFTAHRDGQPEPRLGKGARLLAIGGASVPGRPRIVVGYRALGDSVRIKLLRIT